MTTASAARTYEWVENWARIPKSHRDQDNGRTHAVAVTEAGRIIVFRQANPAVLVFEPNGSLAEAWGDRFAGAHGLTLVREADTEYLWLSDQDSGEVVKTTLDGQTVMRLHPPRLDIYRNATFAPTSVAVNEEPLGGNGDIWVADGYGSNHLHLYDSNGQYLRSINGSEGEAGAFDCPHGLWIDHRRGEGELYIADRGNCQVQVYDTAGRFMRAFGDDVLTSPCGFVAVGEHLVIPELHARVTVLDGKDQVVGCIGANEQVCDTEDWPNVPVDLWESGKFVSPHGVAADAEGNLYVVEWIVGGRIVKLQLA